MTSATIRIERFIFGRSPAKGARAAAYGSSTRAAGESNAPLEPCQRIGRVARRRGAGRVVAIAAAALAAAVTWLGSVAPGNAAPGTAAPDRPVAIPSLDAAEAARIL